jgi:CheY-like chemotaxis protein
MTQQIVNFSRLTPNAASTKIELNDIIGKMCPLMRGAISSDIQLKWHPSKEPVTLLGTEAYICQIVINLVVNARDAIEGGGTIEVSLSPHCNPDDILQIFGEEPPSEAYAELVVTDTGCGMSEETKRRLFEPYFTTKNSSGRSSEGRASGGTGLGLATVQSIVRSLGGAIIVESELGGGSTFRVIVPVVSEVPRMSAEESSTSSFDQPVRGTGERILVIDDEYAVRNVLGLSLTHLGYTLETAASGLEGLDKYAEANGGFDLIILDLLMPGLSGEEVFSRLKRLNSKVKVLIVSGFSSETVVRRLLDNGGAGFIQKPFSIEVLADRVHRCLHE